jgi:hypothetical protein
VNNAPCTAARWHCCAVFSETGFWHARGTRLLAHTQPHATTMVPARPHHPVHCGVPTVGHSALSHLFGTRGGPCLWAHMRPLSPPQPPPLHAIGASWLALAWLARANLGGRWPASPAMARPAGRLAGQAGPTQLASWPAQPPGLPRGLYLQSKSEKMPNRKSCVLKFLKKKNMKGSLEPFFCPFCNFYTTKSPISKVFFYFFMNKTVLIFFSGKF